MHIMSKIRMRWPNIVHNLDGFASPVFIYCQKGDKRLIWILVICISLNQMSLYAVEGHININNLAINYTCIIKPQLNGAIKGLLSFVFIYS